MLTSRVRRAHHDCRHYLSLDGAHGAPYLICVNLNNYKLALLEL